jgi:hypothetical protein
MTEAVDVATPAHAPARSSHRFWAPVMLFYAASLLVAALAPGGRETMWASYAMAFCVGAAVVAAAPARNLLVLFTVGFSQYIVIMTPPLIDAWDFVLATFSPRPAIEVGAACAVGGLCSSILQERTVRTEWVSIPVWLDWMRPVSDALVPFESARKIVTTLMSLATLLLSILSLWNR